MEYEKIKQLMDDMGDSKLTAIEIDFPDGTKISMKKEIKQEVKVERIVESNCQMSNQVQSQEQNVVVSSNIIANNNENSVVNNEEVKKGNVLKSPMVGTFYLKPSPTAEPYVKVGDVVKKGQTLCIIEAMKLMNEIESEFDGKVVEVLVKDGEPVEYGTALFRIEE